MKQFKCDICGKEVEEYSLKQLYENIQQTEIKDICEACNKELTNANYKIKQVLEQVRLGWIEKVINKMLMRKPQ